MSEKSGKDYILILNADETTSGFISQKNMQYPPKKPHHSAK